jgi:TolB-like protein/thioredoxin-like negative regulator of GroEL
MSFFDELKRRNVFRVGIAYVLMGWLLLQAADFAFDLIGAPNWVIQSISVVVLLGLPIALIFAWAFEMTPEGIKRETDVDRSQSITPRTGRKLDNTIIAVLVVVIISMAVERIYFSDDSGPGDTIAVDAVTKSIAVLPFADLSQAQDQAWFADGLAEEILNALVRVPDLQVSARTSSFAYKGTDKPITVIAVELGVEHVLEGSIRSSNDRIRVTAQLIRASDGFHLWSENYDRDVDDMISIQEDLALSIATALETSMDPEALAEMAQVGTKSIEAYQSYLRGLQLRQEALTTSEGSEIFEQAYAQFEKARAIDPGFAEAHVQAANYWKVELSPTRTDTGSSGLQPLEMLREYHERIGQGIQNASNEADRVRSLADRAMLDLRLNESRRLFDQYLELRPNDETTRFELSLVLAMLEDKASLREILAHWKAKGETDSYSANAYINEAYRVIDPSEAADFGLKSLQRWPNTTGLIYQTHRTLMWAGRFSEASQLAARYETLVPGSNPLVLAREACGAGDRIAAEAILSNFDHSVGNNLSAIWLLSNMLGNTREEIESLRSLEDSGVLFSLATFLGYHKFDPRPYPALMAVLEREGVERPPPAIPPFRCPPPQQTSIAVLPFVNMSSDPEQEYFSDGISEEILNSLVKLKDLKVAGRTSSFAFKGKGADLRSIGNALGVNHILEGSVRKSGNQVRITAQLIQADDGFHLWSETYTRELNDIFAVQDEISQAIVDSLEVTLSGAEQENLTRRSTDNVAAYNKYLQGRALWHQRGLSGLTAAIESLREAVTLDPGFADAWAALADALILMPEYGAPQVHEYVAMARDANLRTVEIDPDSAHALTTRAYMKFMYDYDYNGAREDFLRAIELEPTYPTVQQWYGEFLASQGDVEGALAQFRKAAELDPLAPVMWHVAGLVSSQNSRFEEALGYYRRALEISPNFASTHGNLARTYARMGKYDLARQSLERNLELTGQKKIGKYSYIDAMENPLLKAEVLEGIASNPEIYVEGAIYNSFTYMLLGEPELALESLQKGLEAGDPYATFAGWSSVFDDLRDDPRFQAHLAKLNMWP